MNKFKKLFHHEKKELVIIHPHLEEEPLKQEPSQKKKRFSLHLLQQKTEEPIKRLTKSTSFLGLFQLVATENDGQVTAKGKEEEEEDDCSTLVQDDLLHIAATCYSTTTVYSEETQEKRQIYLQLGIQFYEKGELDNATHYWKLSATEENEITPLGTFFYGLALLHGWGCRKSPAIAVRYLQKTVACNSIEDLSMAMTRSITCDTLSTSIYELGKSFWHGWEVPKNISIAVYYFELSARLGNASAMNELGFCFQYGHGVTKDMIQATFWYKQAAQSGF